MVMMLQRIQSQMVEFLNFIGITLVDGVHGMETMLGILIPMETH